MYAALCPCRRKCSQFVGIRLVHAQDQVEAVEIFGRHLACLLTRNVDAVACCNRY